LLFFTYQCHLYWCGQSCLLMMGTVPYNTVPYNSVRYLNVRYQYCQFKIKQKCTGNLTKPNQ
jgi:hypothetical protein